MRRVMIAGHFNPIHSGHIDHIKKAKVLGDFLIVSVNPDEDCIEKSGYAIPLKDRLAVIQALRDVDFGVVSVPSKGNQVETLKRWKPDIFAKGGDRTSLTMVQEEIDICDKLGIEIVYGIGDKLNSSSKIIKDIVECRRFLPTLI